MSEDVTVETVDTGASQVEASKDATVENETSEQTTETYDVAESEHQEPELTVEEKLTKFEKETQAKQAKIDRQLKAYNALQKAHQEIKAEYDAMLQKQQASQAPKEPQPPNDDDFSSYDELEKAKSKYIDDLANFKAEQIDRNRQQEFLQMQQQQKMQQVMQERQNIRARQEAEYAKVNPSYKASYQEVESFLGSVNVQSEVANAVIDTVYEGDVPSVIDYFGRNYGENLGKLQEIIQMPAHKAAIEIYKIQQSIAKTPALKAETRKPPEPVKVAKGDKRKSTGFNENAKDILKELGLK
jgi:chromosome segregation ATPase